MQRSLTLTALAAALAVALPAAHAQTAYTFIDLGQCYPTDVNNKGQICGNSSGNSNGIGGWRLSPLDTNGDSIPDTWYRDTNRDDVNDLIVALSRPKSYYGAYASRINSSGMVVGRIWPSATSASIAVWDAANTLSTPSSTGDGQAINDLGDLGGQISRPSLSASFWKRSGTKYAQTSLPYLPGMTHGMVYAINNNRQAVGFMNTGTTPTSVFLWSAATGTTALPLPAGTTNATARGITNTGIVVGYSSSPYTRPLVWQNGGVIDILVGQDYLEGSLGAVNPCLNGAPLRAVGGAARLDGSSTAILWDGATVVDLCSPAVTSGVPAGEWFRALGVSDSGYIVGTYYQAGVRRGFLLTPQ